MAALFASSRTARLLSVLFVLFVVAATSTLGDAEATAEKVIKCSASVGRTKPSLAVQVPNYDFSLTYVFFLLLLLIHYHK